MLTYEILKKNARKLVSLTSLTPEEFEYLLPAGSLSTSLSCYQDKNRAKPGTESWWWSKRCVCEYRTKIAVCISVPKEFPGAVDYGRTVCDQPIASQRMDPYVVACFETSLGRPWVWTWTRPEKVQEEWVRSRRGECHHWRYRKAASETQRCEKTGFVL